MIFDHPAYVLIDPGSDRSFISIAFARHADRDLVPLEPELIVHTPLGQRLLRNTVYSRCEVWIGDAALEVDLIPLRIQDFDAILGMDWLSQYYAAIDCVRKVVTFQRPGEPEIVFTGERRILPSCIISAIETKRLLQKGCQAYLAHVIDRSVPGVSLEQVPVVREFPDVFPEELP